MKKQTGFCLVNNEGNSVAIIIINDEKQLAEKLKAAIMDEVCAEPDGQFELTIGELGDWGEDTKLMIKYVNDGFLVEEDNFTIVKTVTY